MKNILQQIVPPTAINPSFNSVAIDTSQVLYISAQVTVDASGTAPTFTMKMQASNDIPNTGTMGISGFAPTNWSDVASASVSFTSAGTKMIPSQQIGYRWIRFVNTYASGSGNASVTIFGICV